MITYECWFQLHYIRKLKWQNTVQQFLFWKILLLLNNHFHSLFLYTFDYLLKCSIKKDRSLRIYFFSLAYSVCLSIKGPHSPCTLSSCTTTDLVPFSALQSFVGAMHYAVQQLLSLTSLADWKTGGKISQRVVGQLGRWWITRMTLIVYLQLSWKKKHSFQE